MEVKQVASLVNKAVEEIGGGAVLTEDLSNVVSIGEAVFNASSDNYVRALVNRIGKTVFADRKYQGIAPDLLVESYEFGSVLQKVSAEIPEASEADDYNLEHGTEYSPNVFYKPSVSQKFYNKKVIFEIDQSFTEKQLKQSFMSAEQLNSFLSMLYTAVENSMTLRIDALAQRALNNMIVETVKDASSTKCVNLLALYNAQFEKTLTASNALFDPEFIKYAVMTITAYSDRLRTFSKLFNIGKKERFTPIDRQRLILLSNFASAVNVYLKAGVFNADLLALPRFSTFPFWQGTGENYDLWDCSKVIAKPASGGEAVTVSGVLGVLFDREAVMIANTDRKVTTQYNAKADFYNNFYKFESSYFNDLNENFVVFVIS